MIFLPGKVSYFTATFPYVVMTILVVAGALLDGASEGVSFYLTGENGFNAANLFEPELWKDAVNSFFIVDTFLLFNKKLYTFILKAGQVLQSIYCLS